MGKSERPFKCPYKCPYIKRDGSICGNPCWRLEGCSLHWTKYESNAEKTPCGVCGIPTRSFIGHCPKHASRFYSLDFRMREKFGCVENTPVPNS